MTGIDMGEVERLIAELRSTDPKTGGGLRQHRAADTIAALREKLEAAERTARLKHDMLVDCDMRRASAQKAADDRLVILERKHVEHVAALTEARAGQAAAWEAGKLAAVPYTSRPAITMALTPPADLSTALQAVKDADLGRAAEVCEDLAVGYSRHEWAVAALTDAARDIRALRRAAPTGGEG